MIDANPAGEPARSRRWTAAAVPALAALILSTAAIGCGGSSPPPISPVVAADSEEGRKALAEDQANSEILKQKAFKTARKKKRSIPAELLEQSDGTP